MQSSRVRHRLQIGNWVAQKYRRRVQEAGEVQPVARQLRKQGVPLKVALKVLGIKPTL